jgi:hypothetical protein
MVALWCRDSDSRSAALLLIPLKTVARHVLEPEPVQRVSAGPIHVVLMEPFDPVRRGGVHRERPPSLDRLPDNAAMLAIHTSAGDRIRLGMRPMRAEGTRHVTAAADRGFFAYFFPEGDSLASRLSGFLAHVFMAHIGISRSDADGVAYFAVRRVFRRI